MELTDDQFISVISATPLVAIDLIVRNDRSEVLLGRRRNRPAQDYWFVPGGRIRKNERLQDALQRIGRAELNMAIPVGSLLGIFDHFYDDNFVGKAGVDTHYVAIAYQIQISSTSQLMHDDQHFELRWWNLDALHASREVHQNTKNYFSTSVDNGFRCGASQDLFQ